MSMLKLKRRRRPTSHHWRLLLNSDDSECSFGLQEFLEFWDVSSEELSKICRCSPRSVRRWLVGSVEPSELYRSRLFRVHQIWLRIK
jgi:hypothetical protein